MHDRMDNGVRARSDGRGDGWANGHRNLGSTFQMQDLDSILGSVDFALNGANRIFAEYVPDSWTNRGKLIRDFRLVSIFDRKSSAEAAFSDTLSTGLQLWMCRALAVKGSPHPRFFYIIGGQVPPWRMVEIDATTGRPTGVEKTISSNEGTEFRRVWDALGLTGHRRELHGQLELFPADRR